MWVTVTSPGTELDAAERGLGCLGVASVSYAEQERRTQEYHRRVQQCEPVGKVVNDRVSTMNFLYCHEDRERAVATGMRMMGTFGLLNSHLLFTREGLSHERLPVARQPGTGAAQGVRRSRRGGAGAGGDLRRNPGPDHPGREALGVDRSRRDQLPAERRRDRAAGGGPRQPRAVRAEVMPAFAAAPDDGSGGDTEAGAAAGSG